MNPLTLEVHAASDRGQKRSRNEDSHAVWSPDDPLERERHGVLLVVADGMGGIRGGDVASRLTAETVVEVFSSGPGDDTLADLRHGVEEANRRVYAESHRRAELSGMATTCTAAAVRGERVWLAHVGDSRAYLIRQGRGHQLTRDHSLVASLVDRHELTPEQARTDSRRNVVMRSIGRQASVDVDAGEIGSALEPGDTLLLCSDGLHGPLTDPEIVAAASDHDPARGCAALIALANRRGGPDNVTVILARVRSPEGVGRDAPGPQAEQAPRPAAGRAGGDRSGISAPVILLLMALAMALAALALFLARRGTGS